MPATCDGAGDARRRGLALGLRPGPDTALPSAGQGPGQKDGHPELEAEPLGHPRRAPRT